MRVRVPVIVKDPEVAQWKDIEPTEEITIEGEDLFLAGPTSPRVAVLDFLPNTDRLAPGVPFIPPQDPQGFGIYDIPKPILAGQTEVHELAAAVSVFGAVYKTIQLFEEQDALGRRVSWPFRAPQLLVVPRAGEWANAYYERESHSLQFFFFGKSPVIHTSHSQDIVAHETAHAVFDGVAPDLYHAISPESLAMHEAVADLTALLCSFRCRQLSQRVLDHTNGSIARSTAFSGLGEQFAGALQQNRPYLRDLFNAKSLKKDAQPPDRVDRSDPHQLSEVLSGALYTVMVKIHDELRQEYAQVSRPSRQLVEDAEESYVQQQDSNRRRISPAPSSAAAKALFVASERFKRTLLRGLDYLPPGDVTFADFARAVLAADQASHPDSSAQRDWICQEFVKRGIVRRLSELAVDTNFEHPGVRLLDLEALMISDYLAYDFVNRNRKLLGVPMKISFEVRPRLDVTKLYWHKDGKRNVRECLLKVAWKQEEENQAGEGLPAKRYYTAGATLAIDWSDRRIRARVMATRPKQARRDTDAMLHRLRAERTLLVGDEALGPGDRPLQGAIHGDVIEGALRVHGAGRMLHITQEP